MKLLFLLVLLPFAGVAQERSTGGPSSEPNTTQQKEPAGPAKPPAPRKPRIPGSMVGYIDDAIVGSEVRVRFEDGLHAHVPDRAEFFYAKCGCYGFLSNQKDPAFDAAAPGLGPGGASNLNFEHLYLQLEYAPLSRFSVFTEVPFRWIQPQSFFMSALGNAIPQGFTKSGELNGSPLPNPGGLSDVRVGFKFALAASPSHSVTFQVRAYFPSGNVETGLGTGHYSIEPSLLYYQKISERVTIESQVGDWHPIGGAAGIPTAGSSGFAGDVFSYAVGPSYELYRGERVRLAPVVEMFGWHIISGFQTGPPNPDASGTNIVNLKAGVRTIVGGHHSFYVGFGQALTHAVWYQHLVRAEYRYSF